MDLVLIGMKHCGKSTLGRRLAARTHATFVDTDEQLAGQFRAETGRDLSVREIFRELGADGFAELESRAVRTLAEESTGATGRVIAMGGRAALNPALADVLRGLGRIVYLRVDEPELWRRVSKTGRPAFLTSDDPRAEFMELCRRRRPAYERLADVTVDLDAADVDESLRRLRQAIEENPNAR